MAAQRGFSGVILTGGASTRMGTDKALIDLGGRKMVEIAARALEGAGATELFAVGGDAEGLSDVGLRCVQDQFPGEGPLGAVITALDQATEELVVILACDHISTTPGAVRSVLEALGKADVALPIVAGHPQTTHAAWRRASRDGLRMAFESGARSIRRGIEGLVVARILDADPQWFRDADTPADLPSREPEYPNYAPTALASGSMPQEDAT